MAFIRYYTFPLTKIRLNQFNRTSLDKYTTLVMVSGTYNQISDAGIKKIKGMG